MSEEGGGQDFWDRADEIIGLANQQCSTAANSRVSASLLYATARFNAFIVASNATSVEEMTRDRETAVAYFTEQYRNFLRKL